MRKLILTLAALALFSAGAFAAKPNWTGYPAAFGEGDLVIQGNVGIGYAMPGDIIVPPVGIAVDYALPVEGIPLSFGGYLGFADSKASYSWSTYKWAYEYTYGIIGARAAYHPDFGIDKLDAYAGAMLGFALATVRTTGDDTFGTGASTAGGFVGGGTVGARYFLTPNIAPFAEVGYSIGLLTVGVAFKL